MLIAYKKSTNVEDVFQVLAYISHLFLVNIYK